MHEVVGCQAFRVNHPKLLTLLLMGLLVLPIAVYAGWVVLTEFTPSLMCENTLIQTRSSPDGELQAVTFVRNCGATTAFSTNVSILSAGKSLPNDSGNVLAADADHGNAPSGPGGGPEVWVEWLDSNSIRITHDPLTRVFRAEKIQRGVAISYRKGYTLSNEGQAPSLLGESSEEPVEFEPVSDGWLKRK